MPETKFTTGPWEKKSFDESQLCIVGPKKRNSGRRPLIVIVSIGEGSPDGEANADLINAAPDLFDALNDLGEAVTEARKVCISNKLEAAYEKTILALHKAIGE